MGRVDRGCEVKLALLITLYLFLGAFLGPLVAVFGIRAKNAAEPWGRELPGLSVGRVPVRPGGSKPSQASPGPLWLLSDVPLEASFPLVGAETRHVKT